MLYNVKVKVLAEVEYEVTVESDSESNAENAAIDLYASESPSDFQVCKDYITDYETDTVQLTWECVECGAPVSEDTYRKLDEMCGVCYALAA